MARPICYLMSCLSTSSPCQHVERARELMDDEFIEHAYDLAPVTVCNAVRDARAALKNPPVDAEELLDIYQGQGFATTVAALRSRIDIL